jgi:tRNA-uridine 2-sulfurtransferase
MPEEKPNSNSLPPQDTPRPDAGPLVALFSGGLDSMLAIRVMQQQGFEIEAFCVLVPYGLDRHEVAKAAGRLGVRLTAVPVGRDYWELLRNPEYGYGKAANPCIDCRLHMVRKAAKFREMIGAVAVISGEVLGQRPMSQKRHHLGLIERESGLEGRLLRPLCAKRLPPTIPEREGIVDRSRLHAFAGRRRTELTDLAKELGLTGLVGTSPGAGCALTEPEFAPRIRDLWAHEEKFSAEDFRLLGFGRHYRFPDGAKAVFGRDEVENSALRRFAVAKTAENAHVVEALTFPAPAGLVLNPSSDEAIRRAAGLIRTMARAGDDPETFLITRPDGTASEVVWEREEFSEEPTRL